MIYNKILPKDQGLRNNMCKLIQVYPSDFQQELSQYWQKFQGDYYYENSDQNNFPLFGYPQTLLFESKYQTSEIISFTFQSSCTEHQPEMPFFEKAEKKDRKDAHALSQNLSSKIKSIVCKLLSGKSNKQQKHQIREIYEKYLKQNKVQNNQMILVFAYLFLMQQHVEKAIYSQFQAQFQAYLKGKQQGRDSKDAKEQQALGVKIKANTGILGYLFSLKGEIEVDWEYIKELCQPLFQGRQKKRIDAPLSAGKLIESRLVKSQTIVRQTSNQVALTQTQCY